MMEKHHRLLILPFLVFWICADAHSQKSICGHVKDQHGEDIFAANVFLRPSLHIATATDLNGRFELSIPKGATNDTLCISFIGYVPERIPLNYLTTDSLAYIVLKEDNRMLSTVMIEQHIETSEEFSLEKLDALDIYLSPTASGDALNAVTVLPFSTNTDESANPTFRGSLSNASQVLLNGIPIENPVRNTEINGMGNFSLFNTSLLDDITVYAGNPPLSKSNATAGVVDINTAREIERSHTECSLSLANIGVLRSQKLSKNSPCNCFIQGYTNWQFHEPYTSINNASDQIESFRSNDVGLNFHIGKTLSDNSPSDNGNRQIEGNIYAYFIDESFDGASYQQSRKNGSKANNRRVFTVSDVRFLANQTVYSLCFGTDYSDGAIYNGLSADSSINRVSALETDNRFHLNANIKHYFNNRLWVEAGIHADYTISDIDIKRPVNLYDWRDSLPMTYTDTTLKQFSPEPFIYCRYEIIDGLVFGGGLRGNLSGLCNPDGTMNNTLSWQANMRYTNGCHSLLLSAGHYHGHLSPTMYIPSYQSIESIQGSLEYCFHKNNLEMEAAVYLKRENSPEYIAYRDMVFNDERRIFGIETSIKHDFDHLRCFLSYTCLLSHTSLEGNDYLSANHLPWWIKGSLQYTTSDQLTIALSGQIRPGIRYTPIIEGLWDETTCQFLPVYGDYNSERLGNYCRFDMTINKVFTIGKRFQGVAFATLSNLLNRNNQAGPLYSPDYSMRVGWYYMQPYSVYFGTQVVF